MGDDFRYQIARAAGGLTLGEWRRQDGKGDINDKRYRDADTDLWLPRGVLLWRPRAKVAPARDTLIVEG